MPGKVCPGELTCSCACLIYSEGQLGGGGGGGGGGGLSIPYPINFWPKFPVVCISNFYVRYPRISCLNIPYPVDPPPPKKNSPYPYHFLPKCSVSLKPVRGPLWSFVPSIFNGFTLNGDMPDTFNHHQMTPLSIFILVLANLPVFISFFFQN